MPYPYVIIHRKMNLYLALVDISDLHLHEEVIPQLLNELTRSIEIDGCLKHPIVVDKESLVVLDGMHRVAALRELGCKLIPACFVEYLNPAITVACWYRVIKGSGAPQLLCTQVRRLGISIERGGKIDATKVGESPIVAAVKSREEAFFLHSPFTRIKEAYDIIKRVEEGLKKLALEVSYETESDSLRKLREHKVDAVIFTPKLTKTSVIKTSLSGSVFPHKTTRHVIPARPLYLNVPLSLLRNSEKYINQINKELRGMLQRRNLKHIEAGSILNGRRYEEDLYLFED